MLILVKIGESVVTENMRSIREKIVFQRYWSETLEQYAKNAIGLLFPGRLTCYASAKFNQIDRLSEQKHVETCKKKKKKIFIWLKQW